jgi:Flp pilus assembly protein TadG
MKRKSFATRQRGQIIVMVAVTIVVLIGIAGLAIDSGRAYGVKARLNAAVDAAAIAGARALVSGADDATRQANATAAAIRFFNANYPSGFQATTVTQPTVSAIRNGATNAWTVTVNAQAVMPTTFMKVLGQTDATIAADGQTIRRDVDVMMVLDTSGSLGPPTSPSTTFPTLQSAAITGFVNKFIPGAGGDRLGLVAFASGGVTGPAINKTSVRGYDRTAVTNTINALTVGGSTAGVEGLRQAWNELKAVPAAVRSPLRVILYFSDGAPNDVGATFPVGGGTVAGNLYSETSGPATAAANRVFRNDTRNTLLGNYSITSLPALGNDNIALTSFNGRRALTGSPFDNTRCNVNKAARNMLENIANTARGDGGANDVVIYTIGLGSDLTSLEVDFCGYGTSEYGQNILKRVANTTDVDTYNAAQQAGLYCHADVASELLQCFSTIASEILRLSL